ncbi:MAG TPA: DUF4389 domain-containing protein [Pseudonocardiaceae bacterium]
MGEFLPELDIQIPERQRRLTVLVRLILLIPQDIALFFLSIAAGVVLVLGWFGALFLGRLPYWAAEFLSGYLAYYIRVYAYEFLLVDRYPPFRWRPDDYPVVIRLQSGRLNRVAVFFRIILVIPAAIVTDVLLAGWGVLSFFIWLIVLIIGRMPKPLAGAGYALLRYVFRTQAYFMLLTSAYPKRLFGDNPTEPATPEHRPLVLSEGARAMLVVFIVLGVLSSVTSGIESRNMNNTQTALSGR